jgi:hypothetical protein
LERFDRYYAVVVVVRDSVLEPHAESGAELETPGQNPDYSVGNDGLLTFDGEPTAYDVIVIIEADTQDTVTTDSAAEAVSTVTNEPEAENEQTREQGPESEPDGVAELHGAETEDAQALMDEWASVPGFSISSGIHPRSESTFDTSRTIVGTAPRGAVIRIDVFGYHESTDSFYQVSESALSVGASGSFSSAQQLGVGRNFLRIQASFFDESTGEVFASVETAQLNRLPNEIRSQLERGLLLP